MLVIWDAEPAAKATAYDSLGSESPTTWDKTNPSRCFVSEDRAHQKANA